MGPREWATSITGFRGSCASKCRRAGSRLIIGRGGHGSAAPTAIRRRRCGDSVRVLLTRRVSARRRVRGVIGGSIRDVGGVIGVGSLLRRNLCNVD